jgi:hypothetical protein
VDALLLNTLTDALDNAIIINDPNSRLLYKIRASSLPIVFRQSYGLVDTLHIHFQLLRHVLRLDAFADSLDDLCFLLELLDFSLG